MTEARIRIDGGRIVVLILILIRNINVDLREARKLVVEVLLVAGRMRYFELASDLNHPEDRLVAHANGLLATVDQLFLKFLHQGDF